MYDLWWLIAAEIVLFAISIIDIRKKTVPIWGLIAIFLLSLGYVMTIESRDYFDMAISLLPGAFFAVVSIVTGGKLGMGDAIVLLGLGLGLGTIRTVYMIVFALLLNCIVAIVLVMLKKANRHTRIPFVPFITAGMGLMAYACR